MGLFTEFDFAGMLPNINRLCQLHEHLQVLNLVDAFEAELFVGNGDVHGISARGETIQEALLNLDEILQQYPDVESYRKAMYEARA